MHVYVNMQFELSDMALLLRIMARTNSRKYLSGHIIDLPKFVNNAHVISLLNSLSKAISDADILSKNSTKTRDRDASRTLSTREPQLLSRNKLGNNLPAFLKAWYFLTTNGVGRHGTCTARPSFADTSLNGSQANYIAVDST
jgi:hypothetical protein